MSEKKQKFKIILRTVTPLHIGGSEKVPLIFYKPDRDKVLRLKQRSVFSRDDVVIDNNSISRFFENHVSENDILYSMRFLGLSFDYLRNFRSREVRAFIRLPDGRAYIPGSSIKGALRNVYTIYKLKNMKDVLNKIDHAVSSYVGSCIRKGKRPNKKISTRAKVIDKKITLGEYITQKVAVRNKRLSGNIQNVDCFRALVIRDSKPIDDTVFGVFKVARKGRLKGFSEFIELIPSGVTIEIEGYFDLHIAEILGCENLLDEISRAIDEIGKEFTESERSFWENEANKSLVSRDPRWLDRFNRANLHIGFGGNVGVSSIFNLLNPKTREMVLKVINPRKRDMKNYTEPYSRKVIVDGGNSVKDVIGWVNVKLERL